MYIILAIIAFGVIIAVHELGHFFASKALGVRVNEFAIGMGPKILSRQGKETLYSLRLFPFGGFCSLEGENGNPEGNDTDDGERTVGTRRPDARAAGNTSYRGAPAAALDSTIADDSRSFFAQKRYRRIIILASGSAANFVLAFIIIMLLSFGSESYYSTPVIIRDNLPEQGAAELIGGDKIIAINGERLYYYNDFALFMNLNANKPITFTIERDGNSFEYQRRTYMVDGYETGRYSFTSYEIKPTFTENLKYSIYQTFNFMRLIRVSLAMMFRGEASVSDMAGPIGIVDAMNTVGQESENIYDAIRNIVFFTAFIGINIAVINMLPIPAMDGGRILFIGLTWFIEKVFRKKLDPKYENYINTTAFILLIIFMVFIMYNDVMRLIA
ncbi:MAG: M50 family metallopeptidase [Oscillospiraceae bacterium]|nr:M50 family metallopeptidase [Oscillospiraceae bacterium]